jgi:hypothetical protein
MKHNRASAWPLFRVGAVTLLLAICGTFSGCAAALLVGAMAQSAEYEKRIEVLAQYSDLHDKTVAILVDVDSMTLYEHPNVAYTIAMGVWAGLRQNVPQARLVPQQYVVEWQYRTPMWQAMPYSEVCEELNVDRLIVIQVYEYRLNPPGNSYEWEGVCAASVGVVERDGIDPDAFAIQLDAGEHYPRDKGYTKDMLTRQVVETALLNLFIRETAWLFFDHIEDKYPDKKLTTSGQL